MVARSRSNGEAPTSPPALSRSRPGLTQALVGVMMLILTSVLVYMYRVIDALHMEQQAMRHQLSRISSNGASADAGELHDRKIAEHAEHRPDFLKSAGGHADSVHTAAEDPEAGMHFSADQISASRRLASEDPSAAEANAEANARRLGAMYTVGKVEGSGCYEIADSAVVNIDVSKTDTSACTKVNGQGIRCPDCYISPNGGLSQDVQLTIQECSSSQWVQNVQRSQINGGTAVWVYTFINLDPTYTIKVRDPTMAGLSPPSVYQVPPGEHVQAYCASGFTSFSNRLAFPSMTIPTLTVDAGFTVTSGNVDLSSSAGTFKSSTGVNTLNGNVVIAGTNTLTTGTGVTTINGDTTLADMVSLTVGASDGAGGDTVFKGDVTVGQSVSAMSKPFVVHGAITQNDDADGTAKAFTSATGTVSLLGELTVATGKSISMGGGLGAGTFTSGTGTVSFNGDTTINVLNTFTTGQAAVTLRGDTTISDTKTFKVGATAGQGGDATFNGEVTIGASSSGNGKKTLILNGGFTQNDDADGTTSTFETGTGAISLNGDVSIATNKNLAMASGTGTFSTGSGAVNLGGDTTVVGTKQFTTGTGVVTIKGAPVNFEMGANTAVNFGVASTGNGASGGLVSFFGNVHIGGSDQFESTQLTLRGDFTQLDDADASDKNNFVTATGGVSLQADIAVASGKNLLLQGASDFTTGTGVITINSDTTSGINLNGHTTVLNGKTFTYQNQAMTCDSAENEATAIYCTHPTR